MIHDQGSGLLSGTELEAPLASHLLCAQHWIGNHPRLPRDLFWEYILADRTDKFEKAKDALTKKFPEAFSDLLAVQPATMLVRHDRIALQAEGLFPKTYGKSASFAEHEMARNKGEREKGPTDALIDFTVRYTLWLASQRRICDEHSEDVLVPYALEHWMEMKRSAPTLSVRIIRKDTVNGKYVFTVCRENRRIHVVDWLKKSCTDCNEHAESGKPCDHLGAILFSMFNSKTLPHTEHLRAAMLFLYDKCYHLTALRDTVEGCADVIPASLNVSFVTNTFVVKQAPPKRGPQGSAPRLASSIDNWRTGAVMRRPKTESTGKGTKATPVDPYSTDSFASANTAIPLTSSEGAVYFPATATVSTAETTATAVTTAAAVTAVGTVVADSTADTVDTAGTVSTVETTGAATAHRRSANKTAMESPRLSSVDIPTVDTHKDCFGPVPGLCDPMLVVKHSQWTTHSGPARGKHKFYNIL
jgi:hypothetical protein